MKNLIKAKGWSAGALFLLAGLTGSYVFALGIADTRHNLSSSNSFANATDGTSTTIMSIDQDEICVFCHTPHSAIKNSHIPLWNHTLSTTASYGVYTSDTFDSTTPTDLGTTRAEADATVSNLCLSCHDGSVAINSLNNASNRYFNVAPTMQGLTANKLPTTLSSNLGTDLTNDHPVNFPYDSTKDTGLVATATVAADSGVRLFGATKTVQCASCHDPHISANNVEAGFTGAGKPVAFLRSTMSGSALCLKCHSK